MNRATFALVLGSFPEVERAHSSFGKLPFHRMESSLSSAGKWGQLSAIAV